MNLQTLTAISPIDGRYHSQTAHLSQWFSEYALIKYRLHVEVEYFILLAQKGFFSLDNNRLEEMRISASGFSSEDAEKIKRAEAITNHDVKALEYFIKETLTDAGAGEIKEWVHFGLTSQDINNTATPLAWKNYIQEEYLPSMRALQQNMRSLAEGWKKVPMLARTHGQPASPTVLGKEIMVFVERMERQIKSFDTIPFAAKFGGATGNFNAHQVAFPRYDWIGFANEFVNEILGLQRMQFTTQIEHYDSLAEHFDAMKRINTILIDLCRDIWTYISLDYFKQQTKKGEVGSSAMPHKVNPIDFENAEGNLGLANALLEHLSAKLPISRLQRDLTDSTVLRNLGVPAAHIVIAVKSLQKGLSKLVLNEAKLNEDLENNWAVVAEAVQTILRRENYPNPYEALKDLTRGNSTINKETMQAFINGLQVSEEVKKELLAITPQNYTGIQPVF